jgi:hypothetical protein
MQPIFRFFRPHSVSSTASTEYKTSCFHQILGEHTISFTNCLLEHTSPSVTFVRFPLYYFIAQDLCLRFSFSNMNPKPLSLLLATTATTFAQSAFLTDCMGIGTNGGTQVELAYYGFGSGSGQTFCNAVQTVYVGTCKDSTLRCQSVSQFTSQHPKEGLRTKLF